MTRSMVQAMHLLTLPAAMFIATIVVPFNARAAASGDTTGEVAAIIKGRTIGYVLTDLSWAVHVTPDGKAECPTGFNDGPREQFKVLFPDDGTERKLLDTQLARESAIWHPDLSKEIFPFKEVSGTVGIGLNLDGKNDPNDFTSPDGKFTGIDNQLYRAMGCIANFRPPEGNLHHFLNYYMQERSYDRTLIELSNVDSLVNDDEVTVTTYRGTEGLLVDAAGGYMPGATQHIDNRWGKQFIQRFRGKIVDGVLSTDDQDLYLPGTGAFQDVTVHHFLSARFRLSLTPERAEGLLGGYVDLDNFYRQLLETWSTHHQSYGQNSATSLYRAIHRLADGYPNASGTYTGISGAMEMKFTQVFIEH